MNVVTNPHYALHVARWEFHLGTEVYSTKDVPQRPELIRAALEREGSFVFSPARDCDAGLLASTHSYHEYIESICAGIEDPEAEIYPDLFPGEGAGFVRRIHPLWMGMYCTDSVTPLRQNTYRAAKGSTDAARTAAQEVASGRHKAVYALCRPSGHHAGTRKFGGYCYFNNAGLAALELRKTFAKVAILDIDFHHGNGTQEIFWKRPDVFTSSIHCDPDIEYPYYTGYREECGGDEGEGANLNLPLPKVTNGAGYLEAVARFAAAMERYQPDALVIAAGFDIHGEDPVGGFTLLTSDIRTIGRDLGKLGLPTVICQEGGYNLRVLGDSALSFLLGFREGS